MNELQLITSREFNGYTLDCYVEPEQEDKGAFWATREQIGQLLGYANPRKSITILHRRNQERLSKFSRRYQIDTPSGGKQVTFVYNFMGLLEICRYSNQPIANAVIDRLWEIADEIRRTGSYSVKMTAKERELKLQELKVKEHELENKSRELDLVSAQLIKDMLNDPPFPRVG